MEGCLTNPLPVGNRASQAALLSTEGWRVNVLLYSMKTLTLPEGATDIISCYVFGLEKEVLPRRPPGLVGTCLPATTPKPKRRTAARTATVIRIKDLVRDWVDCRLRGSARKSSSPIMRGSSGLDVLSTDMVGGKVEVSMQRQPGILPSQMMDGVKVLTGTDGRALMVSSSGWRLAGE